jgi:hypothetical protein
LITDPAQDTAPGWPKDGKWVYFMERAIKLVLISEKIRSTMKGAELQADESRTIVGNKEQPIRVFVVIDVWSRLWPSTVVGKRSYHNTRNRFETFGTGWLSNEFL